MKKSENKVYVCLGQSLSHQFVPLFGDPPVIQLKENDLN